MTNKIFGKTLVTCRVHWSNYWFSLGLAALFVIGAISYTIGGKGSDGAILLIGAAFFAVIPLYRILTCRFVLTDKMIYSKTGFIKTKEMSSPIEKVQNISLSSGLCGKLFGVSNVQIDTISGVYTLRGVRGADALLEAFYGLK